MNNNPNVRLLVTCQQVVAWLTIAPEFNGWPAARSYLEQLQTDLEPYLCPTCKDVLPQDGLCPCQDFGEKEPIPFQGEAYPPKVYSEYEEYF